MSEIFGRVGGPRDEDGEGVGMPAAEMDVGPVAGRWLRRHHAAGVYALTTLAEDAYRATTVTAVLDVSLQPLLLMVSLEAGSQMEIWIRESGVLGLSAMSLRHQFLADRFAGLAPLAPARFQGIDHFTAETGSPLLANSISWADCRVRDVTPVGDHVNYLVEVVAAGGGDSMDAEPLISYDGRYARIR